MVSVVIPAYNAEATIGEAVAAARGQDVKGGLEVIVVDDGSSDATARTAELAGARVVRQENRGPASARNTGWRHAKGEIVLFTDSDCRPRKNWASKLLAGFKGEEVAAVAGTYGIWNFDSWLARQIHAEIEARHARMGRYIRSLGSYNVAVKRDVLEELGGFDESFRRASGEDFDLAFKMVKKGYKVAFEPGAVVDHVHTESLVKYIKEQARHGLWRARLYLRHPKMARGDDYTDVKDGMETLMALAMLGLLIPASILGGGFSKALFAILLVYTSLQFGPLMKKTWRTGGVERWPFAGVTFLRGFARSLGLLRGAVRFTLGV